MATKEKQRARRRALLVQRQKGLRKEGKVYEDATKKLRRKELAVKGIVAVDTALGVATGTAVPKTAAKAAAAKAAKTAAAKLAASKAKKPKPKLVKASKKADRKKAVERELNRRENKAFEEAEAEHMNWVAEQTGFGNIYKVGKKKKKK